MIAKQKIHWVPYASPLTELVGSYRVTVNKNCILSIWFESYSMFEGAAHGRTLVASLTTNLKTGKIYQLKDLFATNTNYRVPINRIIKRELMERGAPLIHCF